MLFWFVPSQSLGRIWRLLGSQSALRLSLGQGGARMGATAGQTLSLWQTGFRGCFMVHHPLVLCLAPALHNVHLKLGASGEGRVQSKDSSKVHTRTHTYAHKHTRVHAHTHVRACVRTHTRVRTYACAHTHTCTSTNTNTHTSTNTHTDFLRFLLIIIKPS